uniref:uncharacterized protein LOC120347836 n=1 Tax=Styela clava TaxID=7725 RepID=UPI00193AA603|nr:uncharacterized protein LOC120347836 [Styela clava]
MTRRRPSIAPCNGPHFSHSTPPLILSLLPSEIRYIRLSTSPHLSSGLHVVDLLRRCLHRDISIEELTGKNLEIFTVMKCGEQYWATDGNKRLWVLKTLESMGLCGKISVRVLTRRDYSLWRKLASTACDGRYIEFCSTEAERRGFEQKAKSVLEEFRTLGNGPFSPRPAPSRFFWAPHPTPAQIMMKWVDDEFVRSGNYQWFRGPYNVERPVVLGFIFLFFLISLSVIAKVPPEMVENND